MNITFVASGAEQLPVSLLANMASREGHHVSLAYNPALFNDLNISFLIKYFDDTPYVLEQIRQQQPDVIAFSVLTSYYQWMLHIAREAKKIVPGVKTVFGGVHISAVPDRVILREEVDYVVVGEGEEAFLDILKAIENNDRYTAISNTRFKDPEGKEVRGIQKGFKQDIDTLPPFTKEIWEDHVHIEDFCLTMASRGCPYRCTFCFNNFFAELPETKNKGKYVRSRSVEHMMNELLYFKQRYKKIRWINFEDDIFTVNRKWLQAFLKRYKAEIGVPFVCLVHPKYIDEDVSRWLKEAGCVWVKMGVQTMDEEFKNQSLKRYEKSNHIENAMEAMLKAGLKVKVDHMLGLPGEPIEAQETARRVYAEHCPTRIQTFWTCFLPGTELLNQGMREGIVSPEQAERLNEGTDFFFYNNPNNIKDPELIRTYQGYQLLFKLYPLLPAMLRVRLLYKHVKWIPASAQGFMGKLADVINGMRYEYPEFTAYLKYYRFHVANFFRRKWGWKTKSATVPVNKELFDYNLLKKQEQDEVALSA